MEVKETCSKRPRQAKLGGEDDGPAAASGNHLLRPWHNQASRIFRVSRTSGRKDRHSKVYTSKGLRDRRVRLSVSTAIQFYDLQDRLGYDQPSKAIEWLIKAADSAIAELPSLDSTFPPDHPEAKRELANVESSTSETSKGSVLSLSRSERASKDKDPVLTNLSSLTDLLTGGAQKHVATTTANYFGTESGLFANNSSPMGMLHFGNSGGEQQQFAFLQQDQFGGDHYNLNFSISPGLVGFHRGTLQSNSPPHHHHHHHSGQQVTVPRLLPLDGPGTMPFLFSASAAAATGEGQYAAGFDGHLQLCEGYKHLELKGKGKS